jgi:hypothetical protein
MIEFDQNVRDFIAQASKYQVRMIMVGGTAVNFHGYQRHSADVDFWIESSVKNLINLKKALHQLGFDFADFPEAVYNKEQNISIKISPEMELELITAFTLSKSFDEAYEDSDIVELDNNISYRIISFEDLLENKERSGRPKDLLDIMELKRLSGL